MIELQRLTGMRPGEACQMRTCDIDVSGKVWVYVPGSHKTEHHGKARMVYLGPRAQVILSSWINQGDPDAFLFSPKQAMEERWVQQRRDRKTPLTPSQKARVRKRKPRKSPGDRYTVSEQASGSQKRLVSPDPGAAVGRFRRPVSLLRASVGSTNGV
jgi:integrase